jgi:DNA modification methylase
VDNLPQVGSQLVTNQLFYGDNLEILRNEIPDESVDLIYLDPPFNSNRSYNVLFKTHAGVKAAAQIEAFNDTWVWSYQTEELFDELVAGGSPQKVADALIAMKRLLGENDVMAYMVMMTARLVELHRVLKSTGSLYLHCDPTASHYLKVMMDAIFSPTNFRSEITWQRTSTHNDAKRWSPNADIIFYYGKTNNVTWNPVYLAYTNQYRDDKYRHKDSDGRIYRLGDITSPNPRPNLTYVWKGHQPPPNGWRFSKETMKRLDKEGRIWYPDSKAKRPQLKRYLDEQDGTVAGNIWTDISPINSRAAERLGYPTQKPLALLERIISASSNPGDIVLDPFCGCGTTIDAAQKLDRQWVGIDVTYLAIDLIEKRLERTYGEEIQNTYVLRGVPKDVAGAQALFDANAFDFERWAVSLVDGQPNEKQVGDKGKDGIIRFATKPGEYGSVIVSVKGGKTVNPAMVRELDGTVKAQKADMGVLITLSKPTKGMKDAAQHTGSYTYELSGHTYPKVQIITIEELFAGKKVDMPTPMLPYKLAKSRSQQTSMF